MFTIGTLSSRTGVNIETIRYYERVGLLLRPHRTDSGRRVYGDDTVQRLAFIRHARELGFSHLDIHELLSLQNAPEASCLAASKIATAQLTSIRTRIAKLQALDKGLTRMLDACANGRVAECRVIAMLGAEDDRTPRAP